MSGGFPDLNEIERPTQFIIMLQRDVVRFPKYQNGLDEMQKRLNAPRS
jgi:hypothetical protein